jgi:lipopolysaccharide/colanic/teichoic acid biosynthesis glycosyltransferase
MLDRALKQVKTAARLRRHSVYGRGGKQPLVTILLAIVTILALPIGYASVLPNAVHELLLIWPWDPVTFLPAAANALVMISSARLTGRLDLKLAASFNRVLIFHGALAFAVLALRLPYSNQIMWLAAMVSCIIGPLVMWLMHDSALLRIAVVGPCTPLVGRRYSGFDVIDAPDRDISAYDILLTPDVGGLSPEWTQTLSKAMLMGKTVRHFAEYVEEAEGTTSLEHFDLEHVQNHGLISYQSRKRLMDIVLALLVLPVALPLIGLACLAIRMTMGGPVLFSQDRAGLGGQPFRIYKLRTMRPASPDEVAQATGAGNQARITHLGAVLRKFRIDELPQLWNVLKGDMSIIGPRPEWIVLSRSYSADLPAYAYRNLVRPGITGWAQVKGGYASDLSETKVKVSLDLYYIKNFSFALDMQILLRTIWTLLSGHGAR